MATELRVDRGLSARRGSYELRRGSVVLPELDLAALSRFVKPGENQTELVIAYQDALRAR